MSRVLYDSKLDAWQHSGAKRRLEVKARYRDADLRPVLREQRSIVFYPEGSFIRIQGSDDYEPHQRKQKPRSRIGGFSAKSRGRLMSLCAQLNRNAVALFLTLTWPGVWNPDPETWKTCLDTFLKRLVRAYPECSGIWKLEPQERGAPHFHLLLFGVDFIHHSILAQWWYEVVGSGDERHLQAGIRIEAVRSREGVMHYASKLYMGKANLEISRSTVLTAMSLSNGKSGIGPRISTLGDSTSGEAEGRGLQTRSRSIKFRPRAEPKGARRRRDGGLKAVFAFILSVVDAGRGKGKNKISFKC